MAGWFQKKISGLDFWDKDENARQREQFKREDEEERRRRQNPTSSVVRPGSVIQPSNVVNDTPLKVATNPVFSQSDFVLKKPAAQGFGLAIASDSMTPEQKREKVLKDTALARGHEEIEKMTNERVAQKEEQIGKQLSWFDKNVSNRDWEKDARVQARSSATTAYQEKYGYNKQPEVMETLDRNRREIEENTKTGASKVIAPVLSVGRVGTGIVEGFAGLYDMAAERSLNPTKSNRVTKASVKKAEEIDKLAKDLQMEDAYKVGNVVGEVGSYFLPGGLAAKGGKAAKLSTKATTKIDDILRIAQKTPRLRKFIQEGAEELLDPKNLEKELELTGRYMGQDAAREEHLDKGDVAENVGQSVFGAFLPAGARRALKKLRGGKQAANAAEELVDDAVIAGTGGTTNRVVDSATSKLDDAVEAPGSISKADNVVVDAVTDKPPEITVTDGVKSSNMAKPNPDGVKPPTPPAMFNPNVPNPATDPIALAKAGSDPSALAAPTVQQPIPAATDLNAPLMKADLPEPIAPPQVAPVNQVDAAGNEALISDVQAARELPENGYVPPRENSVIDSKEQARARARDEAEANQVNLADTEIPAYQRGFGDQRTPQETYLDEASAARGEGNAMRDMQELGLNPGDAENVPAYIRRNGPDMIADNQARIAEIETQLMNTPEQNATAFKFDLKQKLAQDLRENPGNRDAIIRDYNRKAANVGKFEDLQAYRTKLIDERNALENDSKNIGMMLDKSAPAPEVPAVIDNAVPSVEAPGSAILPDSFAPTPAPDTAILPDSFSPAPVQAAPSPAPVVDDVAQTGAMPSANTVATDPSPTTGLNRTAPIVTDDVSAPLTREQILGRTSEETADDLMQNAPKKETVSLADSEMKAQARLREMSDESLVDVFANGKGVDSPEEFYLSLNGLNRLDQLDTSQLDEATKLKVDQARRGAFESMAGYAEASGRGLRTVQVLFDKMPPTMKVEYLMKKLGTALGDAEQGVREQLTTLVNIADNSTTNLRSLEDRAKSIMESIENGSFRGTDADIAAAKSLKSEIKKARRDKELKAGDAYRFFKSNMPKDAVGKQAGQWGRTLMLSAPSGRIFDLFSTATTYLDDIVTGKVSSVIGKGVNLFKPGQVISKSGDARELLSGTWEGFKDTGRAILGKDRVDNFEGAAKRSSRGDTGSLDNPVANFIRGIVEAPTNLTRGQFNDKLYSQTLQDAQKRGLKGDDAKIHAALGSVVPSEKQLRVAKQAHLKVNMLQDNPISRGLNKVANAMDDNGKASWLTPIIRNQVAPFTSWLGGNLNRTLTDKNMLWNAGSIVREGLRGNTQGAIDSLAKLGVNTAETFAIGLTLTRAGVIVDYNETGDESDDYAGVYFKFGDRYIPVAVAGTLAVPLIMGNAVDKGFKSVEEGGDFMEAIGTTVANNVINLGKNTGVAGVFGGENNLQKNAAEILRGNGDTPGEMLFDPLVKFGANMTRQYIPGALSDVNALLDSNSQLNPTGEAAATKVLQEGSKKTDVVATEWNKTLQKIPFASQALDREVGKPAKDMIDRIFKSSRGTVEQETEAVKTRSVKDMERSLKKDRIGTTSEAAENAIEDGDFETAMRIREYQAAQVEADPNASEKDKSRARDKYTESSLNAEGVATDDEGIKARAESGDYDLALRGLEYQYGKIKNDKNTPKSEKLKMETEITRLGVTKDGNFPPAVIALYNSISNSDWRNMIDPAHEDFNAERAGLLEAYDKAMAEKGVSRDDSNPKVTKYYQKGARGRGGGSGKGDPRGSLNIFTNQESFDNFSPIKPEKAIMAARESAIPLIKSNPINDRSKLKKITLKKGSRT